MRRAVANDALTPQCDDGDSLSGLAGCGGAVSACGGRVRKLNRLGAMLVFCAHSQTARDAVAQIVLPAELPEAVDCPLRDVPVVDQAIGLKD